MGLALSKQKQARCFRSLTRCLHWGQTAECKKWNMWQEETGCEMGEDSSYRHHDQNVRFLLEWGWVGLNVNRIGQKKVIDVMADTCTNTIWRHLMCINTPSSSLYLLTHGKHTFWSQVLAIRTLSDKKSHMSEFDFLWRFFYSVKSYTTYENYRPVVR